MMGIGGFHTIAGPVRTGARAVLHSARGAPVRVRVALARRGRGPLLACLPSRGPEQSSLLRIYNLATALGGLGWGAVVIPPTLPFEQRQAVLAQLEPDIVLMQGARHPLNRPAFYPGHRIVYDMDDADFHLPHLAGPVAEAMPEVDAVIAGSAYVADWCVAAGARAAHVVWTGTPVSPRPRRPQAGRPPIVAWAQTRPASYVREAAMVRSVMARVASRRPGVTLRLYDRHATDDPAFAESFRCPGLTVEWCRTSRYRDYLASFDDVAVGLAPLCPESPFSRGKSFGKVLAYLDRNVPVVGSDACEHGRFFTADTGVITNDPEAWADGVVALLGTASMREAMAEQAFAAFVARLSTTAAAARVDAVLSGLCAGAPHDAPRLAS